VIELNDNQKRQLARERAAHYRLKRDGYNAAHSDRISDYILIVLIALTVLGILYIEALVPLFERLINSLTN